MIDKVNFKTVLQALSENYSSVHVYDIKNNLMESIKTNSFIEKWSEGLDTLQAKLLNIMDHVTAEESVELIRNFVNFETLSQRLKGKKRIGRRIDSRSCRLYV